MIVWTKRERIMSNKALAIASCRVSTPEQLTNNSLTRQHANVLKAAEELDVPIVRYWSGSMSSKHGTNLKRKDILEMVEFCKHNKQVKYLIVDEPDRFMRSIKEGNYFEVVFEQLGVKVWYASDPVLNGEDLVAKLLKFSKYFSAEGSNEERQRKSINGQVTALKNGKYPFSPKPGYMRGDIAGIQVVHPERGPALKEVLIKISEQLVTPTEGLIELNKSSYNMSRAPIKMDKFRKIATDAFYSGVIEIKKQVNFRNENGLHEPLITMDQHNKIVAVFANKNKNQLGPRKNGNPKYPMNSIISHDVCLSVDNKGKFVGFDHGNGKNKILKYEKYRCRSCGFILTREEMHSKIVEQFEKNRLTPEAIKALGNALEAVWKTKEAQASQDSSLIRHKMTIIAKDIEVRTLAAIEPSNVSIKQDILNNIEKMKHQLDEMELEISSLSYKIDTDKEVFMKFAFDFIKKMGDNFLTISPDDRKKCKQILFPAGFYIDSQKNVYTPEISTLIRLGSKKKDTEVSEKSLLVRVRRL